MIFTIELKGMGVHYRRQNDNSWRPINEDLLLNVNDFQTNDPEEVVQMSSGEGQIELDGISYNVNPTVVHFGHDNVLNSTSTVFRQELPKLPSVEQLREVIAGGDDSQHNSLILNVYGDFELRPRPPYDISLNDPTVIVRNETYSAGNGYVGTEAAQDEKHIEQEYAAALAIWLRHLKTGVTRVYCDAMATKPVNDILSEIYQLEQNWVPQY